MKFWLRGPADNPQVEVVGEYAESGSRDRDSERPDRSVLRELLTEDEAQRFRVTDGVWYLPGGPP